MIEIKSNNFAELVCAVKKSDGTPQDITGWTFEFQVRYPNDPRTGTSGAVLIDKTTADPAQILITNGPAGLVSTYIRAADTVGKYGQFFFEMKGTDPSNNPYTLEGPEPFVITQTGIGS